MFSKGNKTQGRDQKAGVSVKAVPSIISADLSITGDLVSAGEIQIDGSVEGDIECKTLSIGVNGSVTGEIEADTVRLHGRVTGQVRAKTVFLAATARMTGDIIHESLAIEPGAFVEGHCRRLAEPVVLDHGKKPDLKIAEVVDPDSEVKGEEDKAAEAVLG